MVALENVANINTANINTAINDIITNPNYQPTKEKIQSIIRTKFIY